jgi:hypothetical protein
VVASLKGAAAQLRAAQVDIDQLGEKGDPGDVIKLIEDLDPQLAGLAGGIVGPAGKTVEEAGLQVRTGVRVLRSLQRTREENAEHAAQAFRDARAATDELFGKLMDKDKALEEEIRALEAPPEMGAGGEEAK